MCFLCQVCVRVASAPCLTGSGRSRRRTVRSLCASTPTSCGTAGTGSMRTVITGHATGIRWRCRWAGTGFRPAAWTLTFTCGTAKQTLSTFLKVFISLPRVYLHAFEYKNTILAQRLKEYCIAHRDYSTNSKRKLRTAKKFTFVFVFCSLRVLHLYFALHICIQVYIFAFKFCIMHSVFLLFF